MNFTKPPTSFAAFDLLEQPGLTSRDRFLALGFDKFESAFNSGLNLDRNGLETSFHQLLQTSPLSNESKKILKQLFNQAVGKQAQSHRANADFLTGIQGSLLVGSRSLDSGFSLPDARSQRHPLEPSQLTQFGTAALRLENLSADRTVSAFNLKADLTDQDNFYDLPYPSNLRLDAQGHPDLTGFPIWDNSTIVQGLKAIADDSVGFPTTSVGYFRFNAPLPKQQANKLIPADINSPILLIDVDPNSPERGRLFPTVASTPRPDRYYVPNYLLGVAPYPGIILHPDRQYAYVVQRSLQDAEGQPLAIPQALKQLMNGKTPQGSLGAKARQLYQPLWKTLDQIGIDRKAVAAATVFTTGNVVAETARLSQQIVDRYDLTIRKPALDPVDGASHERFWELQGTIRFPQFQQGQPPFNNQGLFQFAADGSLIEQRRETAPVTITIPKTPMPAGGYPVVVYYHGSNGLSTQGVDRGPITQPGGEATPGLGPAHVLAEYGFATIASALPLNPERLANAPKDAYLNYANLAAYRDTFRQGILEQRLLLEALDQLEIAPAVISNAAGSLLPAGETAFQFQTSSVLAMGQSHGAQYANMLSAIEPNIKAVVPTGSPGFWSLLLPENNASFLIGVLLGTFQKLDPLYPGLHLLQTAWESVDPIAYVRFIAQHPLPGQPIRSIYQPVGQGDTEVPEVVFNALALASGVKQAGSVLWPDMQTSLALKGLDGVVEYPVANNVLSENGTPYTGVVVQYAGDGIADAHMIFSQLGAVKFQYANFFDSFIDSGIAVVSKPPRSRS